MLADALPPVTFDMGVPGWVPTVELTVLVRAVPAPGWLVAEQRAQLLQDGWLDEECSIWDSRERLVCQARQLAGYRLPSQARQLAGYRAPADPELLRRTSRGARGGRAWRRRAGPGSGGRARARPRG